jgi:hypothetical protein
LGIAAWAAAAWNPFFLIPRLDNPGLQALSAWAGSSTLQDAMFLLPDAGQELHPGIFRASALRAV